MKVRMNQIDVDEVFMKHLWSFVLGYKLSLNAASSPNDHVHY